MKRSRFTDQQIAFALQQAEQGTQVGEVTRKMGISEQTFYHWKKKFGGLMPSEVRKLRQLEEENARLRYGYRRTHTLLQQEGWGINHKRVYRLYCPEGLQRRHKLPRRRPDPPGKRSISPYCHRKTRPGYCRPPVYQHLHRAPTSQQYYAQAEGQEYCGAVEIRPEK